MGARCFTWNNWRGSGKCEKPCEGAQAPPKGWRLFHVEHSKSMEAQTVRFRGAVLSRKDSGPAFWRTVAYNYGRLAIAQCKWGVFHVGPLAPMCSPLAGDVSRVRRLLRRREGCSYAWTVVLCESRISCWKLSRRDLALTASDLNVPRGTLRLDFRRVSGSGLHTTQCFTWNGDSPSSDLLGGVRL